MTNCLIFKLVFKVLHRDLEFQLEFEAVLSGRPCPHYIVFINCQFNYLKDHDFINIGSFEKDSSCNVRSGPTGGIFTKTADALSHFSSS